MKLINREHMTGVCCLTHFPPTKKSKNSDGTPKHFCHWHQQFLKTNKDGKSALKGIFIYTGYESVVKLSLCSYEYL